MKQVFLLLFLVLSLPLVQAGTFEEWVEMQPPLVVEEGEIQVQTAQQCIAKAEQTNDLVDQLDSGLYQAFYEVTNLMSLVCQINGIIDMALNVLNLFMGCICVLSFIGGDAICEGVKAYTATWKIAGIPVSQMCCYFTNGLCGLATCGATSGADAAKSNDNNVQVASAASADTGRNARGSGGGAQKTTQTDSGGGFGASDVVSGITAKENAPSLTAGISPYDNVFLAAACMSPGAMVHHLQTLRTIYKTQECCVKQACENELSPATCDDAFQENMCTFIEGSFLGSIVGWLAYQATYRVVQWILTELIGKKLIQCLAVFVDLVQTPQMIEGVIATVGNIGSGGELTCEDLGFKFQAINEEKKLKRDSSVIDEQDEIGAVLSQNNYVVDSGYNVNFARDFTSRSMSVNEKAVFKSSLEKAGYDVSNVKDKSYSVWENEAGKQVVKVDGFLGSDVGAAYFVSDSGKIDGSMREVGSAQELVNHVGTTSPRTSVLTENSYAYSKQQFSDLQVGQVVVLPDGITVDTTGMSKSGNTYNKEGVSLVVDAEKITYVKEGVSTSYSDYGKISTSSQGVSITSADGRGSLSNVPAGQAEIKLKALYYGIPAEDVGKGVVNGQDELEIEFDGVTLTYGSSSNVMYLQPASGNGNEFLLPVEAVGYVISEVGSSDFSIGESVNDLIITTEKGTKFEINAYSGHTIISETKQGGSPTYKILLSDRRGFDEVSEEVANHFTNSDNSFTPQQYEALSKFGSDVKDVKVNDLGQFYLESNPSTVAFVQEGNTVVYKYTRQEQPAGISNLLEPKQTIYYTEFDSSDGTKGTLRSAPSELSWVSVDANNQVGAVVTDPIEIPSTFTYNSFLEMFNDAITFERNPEREAELKAQKEEEIAQEKERQTQAVLSNNFLPQVNLFGLFEFGLQETEISEEDKANLARASVSNYIASYVGSAVSGLIENEMCQEEIKSSVPRTTEPSDSAISGNQYCTQALTSLSGKIIERIPVSVGYTHNYEYSMTACKEDLYYRVSLGTCQTGCSLEQISEGRLNQQDPPLIVQGSINVSTLHNWLCIETTDVSVVTPYCIPFELTPVQTAPPPVIELPYACAAGFEGPNCVRTPTPTQEDVDVCALRDDVVIDLNAVATPADLKTQYSYTYEVTNCAEELGALDLELFLVGDGITSGIERRSGDGAIRYNQTRDSSGRVKLFDDFTQMCLKVGNDELCKSI